MMKLVALFIASMAFADGLGSEWTALNDQNVKVTKGENEHCAGGLVNVSSTAGTTTLQIGPLIHIEYKKSGETVVEPEGSEDCRVERKTTEIAGGLQRDVSFTKCEDPSDNRAFRETLTLKKEVISYERKATAGNVTSVQCRFQRETKK